jgi:DNA polymerase III epsilon subunit-like protein
MANQPTLIVLDYETTGRSPESSCVWQVGACAVRGGEIISEFESKVRPSLDFFQAEHREVVRKVSGLDDAGLLALLDAPKFAEVVDPFQSWLHAVTGGRKAKLSDKCGHAFNEEGECVLCFSLHQDVWTPGIGYPLRLTSFNAAFDRGFYEAEGWGWVAKADTELPAEWQPCIMDLAAKAMGRTGPHNTKATRYGRVNSVPLKQACKRYEVELINAHDGLADARAVAQLAIKLGME